jgi:hypothetical protein
MGCPETSTPDRHDNGDNNGDDVSMNTPILFETNKNAVKESSMPVVRKAVKELKENKKSIIEVHGYADIRGSKKHNDALSKKRATAVKNLLQTEGANPSSIKTIGHGTKNPVGDNRTEEGRAQNRRVEMKLKARTTAPAKHTSKAKKAAAKKAEPGKNEPKKADAKKAADVKKAPLKILGQKPAQNAKPVVKPADKKLQVKLNDKKTPAPAPAKVEPKKASAPVPAKPADKKAPAKADDKKAQVPAKPADKKSSSKDK